MDIQFKKTFIAVLITCIAISSVFGAVMGFWAGSAGQSRAGIFDTITNGLMGNQTDNRTDNDQEVRVIKVEEESAVIEAVEKVSPAVVSIIVTKDLPVIERYYSEPFGSDFFRQFFGEEFDDFFGFGVPRYRENGTQEQEIGGGTGFLVSPDGYIVTNRHVVFDQEADYTVLMNDGSKYEAEVLGRDTVNDLAVLKVNGNDLPSVQFGDSSSLKVGQTVIAIGNSLGEFRNTVSKGVISGLSRSVVAGSVGIGSEQLTGVIQTDASINPGNSGGPLLNLTGQVIGINTAMAAGAENIGFAIPANDVKNIYESVKEHGRIVRPWLGVRYIMINEMIQEANNLEMEHGALIVRGESQTELAVMPGSPADKAGLAENDIILKVDDKEINQDNPLNVVLSKYMPGDTVTLTVYHQGEEKEVKVTLEEME